MKVIVLQDTLRGGGTERQSIQLTKALCNDGIDTQLWVGYAGSALDSLAQETLASSLNFCSRSKSWALPATLLKLRSTTATIVCMGRWAHYVGALLPTNNSRKLIATIRTSRPLPKLYLNCIRKADHLIANSEWALNYTKKLIPRDRLLEASVVYNELSRPRLFKIDAEAKKEARSSFNVPEGKKILLNVSRFSKGKGQADLIEMMQHRPAENHQLWLVGNGPEKTSAQMLSDQPGLREKIRFFDFTEDLEPFFASADIFVSASQLDSFPNAMLEAQAAGLPVVAYPTAGIPELLQADVTGLLTKSKTPEALHEQITSLEQSPERMTQFGMDARKRVLELFSGGKQEAKFCGIIESL
ncbi:MAG: glycosyltransferase family 4 protein [Verrucomicrobiota bacterium]